MIGDTVSLHPAVALRNVAFAKIHKRTLQGRHLVQSLTVRFGKPIPTTATALAALLDNARISRTGSSATLHVPGGTLRLEPATGGVKTVTIAR